MRNIRIILLSLFCIVILLTYAFFPSDDPEEEIDAPIIPPEDIVFSNATNFGFTYHNPDGNRFVLGNGTLPDVEPLDISLDGKPEWIVSAPMDNGSVWVVVLETGQVQTFLITDDNTQELSIAPSTIPAGMPPLLQVKNNTPELITDGNNMNALSHPVVLNESGRIMSMNSNGSLSIESNDNINYFDVDGLPDARILFDENERLLFLSGQTTEYGHGIMGDGIEASRVTLVDLSGSEVEFHQIDMPDGLVIEGLLPIWTDITGDGIREIIITVSNAQQGGQILVFSEDGKLISEGPAIGTGYRWRHQLAAAPFGPVGEMELAEVLTPHIGGKVGFYRMDGDEMKIVATVGGYTSHMISSRNLDIAAAADFDSDGIVELLLPSQTYVELGAIHRTPDGAEVDWTLALPDKLSTNIAALNLKGKLIVGVGTENNNLRIWK